MKIESDPWLARIIGHEVFRVIVPEGNGVSRTFHIPVQETPTSFYYAKVPTNRIGQVRSLTAAGFQVVDVNMTFERWPAESLPNEVGRAVTIREICPQDHEQALMIAGSCFVYSRFHLDPRVPAEVKDAIKRAWVQSYIDRRRGERLLIALVDDRCVGFLAVLSVLTREQAVRVIDLIGVDKNYQGQGVGRALVEFFVNAHAGTGDLLRVGTQAANIPSMRLYERCGFRTAGSSYVLHAHVKDGQVLS